MGNVKNAFEHPLDASRKVYVLSDVSHLFKCILNHLNEKKILKRQGQFIKLSCYDALYVADTKHAAELRVCPKLTYDHVSPSNMLKMRVKLATQVFSNSVAKGIQYYHAEVQLGFIMQSKLSFLHFFLTYLTPLTGTSQEKASLLDARTS